MVSQKKWLIVRDLEEYFFCPRMFYYKHVLGYEKQPRLWSSIGREIQEELSSYIHSRFKVVDEEVYLESNRLGVRGRVDYIVETEAGIAPLEVKYSRRLKPWWRYTLVLYALLIEDHYGKPVKQAFMVIPSKRVYMLNIEDHDRRYVIESIRRARRIIEGYETPRPYPSRSCMSCDYQEYCRE